LELQKFNWFKNTESYWFKKMLRKLTTNKKFSRFISDQYSAELLHLSNEGFMFSPLFFHQEQNQLLKECFDFKNKFKFPTEKPKEFHKITQHNSNFEYQSFDKEFSFLFFEDEENFPEFAKELLPALKQEVVRYQCNEIPLKKWKLTMNFYECENLTQNEEFPLADFFRHQDDFGVFLFTAHVGSPRILQIIRDKQMNETKRKGNEILLAPGSLLKQMAKARWEYMSRIKPTKKTFEFDSQSYEKQNGVSLVFGCK
jgi:hypothetical protein